MSRDTGFRGGGGPAQLERAREEVRLPLGPPLGLDKTTGLRQ